MEPSEVNLSLHRSVKDTMLFCFTLNGSQGSTHPAERVSHTGVPRRIARHLRRMIRNQHPIEAVLVQKSKDAKHIRVALVHEDLVIVGNLANDIAQMYVGDAALLAVVINRLVD